MEYMNRIEEVKEEILGFSKYLIRNSHPSTETGNCKHEDFCESSIHCGALRRNYQNWHLKRTAETSGKYMSFNTDCKNHLNSNQVSLSKIDPLYLNSAVSDNDFQNPSKLTENFRSEKVLECDKFQTNNEFDSFELTVPPYASARCKFIHDSFIDH